MTRITAIYNNQYTLTWFNLPETNPFATFSTHAFFLLPLLLSLPLALLPLLPLFSPPPLFVVLLQSLLPHASSILFFLIQLPVQVNDCHLFSCVHVISSTPCRVSISSCTILCEQHSLSPRAFVSCIESAYVIKVSRASCPSAALDWSTGVEDVTGIL